MRSPRRHRGFLALLALALGCASTPGWRAVTFGYFTTPLASDAWSPKIAAWQSRERALVDTEQLRAPASVSGSGEATEGRSAAADLRSKYFAYRAEQKREMARGVAEWIQRQAPEHYIPDGVVDHWATLEETLEGNGDDCDGLELLVFHFLRDLGFRDDEVYRAIVYRPSDGQHHMVTFWFESTEDPWVIDPTGAMTSGMPRMSEVDGWVPLKVFSVTEDFTVEKLASSR